MKKSTKITSAITSSIITCIITIILIVNFPITKQEFDMIFISMMLGASPLALFGGMFVCLIALDAPLEKRKKLNIAIDISIIVCINVATIILTMITMANIITKYQ